jgi:hypothetical protein|tara:strand:- start:1245 stop:1403 length:159 start_codon:yes stop_codon:yes gene_type:complete
MKQKKYKYIDEDQEEYLDSKKIEKLSKAKKSIKKKRKLKNDFTDSDDWYYEG